MTNHSNAAPHTQPNIVLILADDLGCDDISLYDGWVKTPRIDQMAQEGVTFTDFHSNGSVCSPTRVALLTGRYQQRAGVVTVLMDPRNPENEKDGIEPSELTLATLMKQAGYRTGIFGKWHCGYAPRHNPTRHGFDEFVGFLGGGCDYLVHDNWIEGKEIRTQEGYSTHIITDKSVDFIKRNKDNPFFLYVSHQAVHNFYQIPSDTPGSNPREIPLSGEVARDRYKIILEDLDASVGKVLDTLKELDLEKDTFVFFFSDNGAVDLKTDDPHLFRGFKFSNYEGGHRVPAVARWPGRIKENWTSDALIMGMDLLPTIMDILGVTNYSQRQIDGISFTEHLFEETAMPDRQVFFSFEPRLGTAMRDGNWKLQTKGDDIELYDLDSDIKETTNVCDDFPERAAEMKAAVVKWKKEVALADQ